jgi:hypothetical protein
VPGGRGVRRRRPAARRACKRPTSGGAWGQTRAMAGTEASQPAVLRPLGGYPRAGRGHRKRSPAAVAWAGHSAPGPGRPATGSTATHRDPQPPALWSHCVSTARGPEQTRRPGGPALCPWPGARGRSPRLPVVWGTPTQRPRTSRRRPGSERLPAHRRAPGGPAQSAARCAGEPSPWRRASAQTATDAAAGAARGTGAAPEGATAAPGSGRHRPGSPAAAWAGALPWALAHPASHTPGAFAGAPPSAHGRRRPGGRPQTPTGCPAGRLGGAHHGAPGAGPRRRQAARTGAQVQQGGAGPLGSPRAPPSASTCWRRWQTAARAPPQAAHAAQQWGPGRRSASPQAGAQCSEGTTGPPARRGTPRHQSSAPRRLLQGAGRSNHTPSGRRRPKVAGCLGGAEPVAALWVRACSWDACPGGDSALHRRHQRGAAMPL